MVSIILPNYNHSGYLQERIESILNQTYRNFELIILDDKSTDKSVEIIEKYRDREEVSHIIVNEENSGSTFKQWNRGFSLAKGEYIWIAESDDYADLTFLEKCVNQLDANPQASFCYTDSYFCDDKSEVIQKYKYLEEATSCCNNMVYDGKEYLYHNLLRINFIYNASMVVFRKSYIPLISDFYISLKASGDWSFWGELAALGDVIRVNEKLNYFRQHQNKVSVNATALKFAYIESVKVVIHLLHVLYPNSADNYEIDADIKLLRALIIKHKNKNLAFKLMDVGYLKKTINRIMKFEKLHSEDEIIYVKQLAKELGQIYSYAPIASFIYNSFRPTIRSIGKVNEPKLTPKSTN